MPLIPSSFLCSLLWLSLARAIPLQKRDYPPVGACSGDCAYVHDPSVVKRADGTYFRFVTFNKITIATAPSLSGPWTNQGAAIPAGSSIDLPGKDDLWAPDVFSFDSTYYMYYAVSTGGSQNSDIGVATSSSMDVGSWTDHGSIGIPANTDPNGLNYNKIDPNLLLTDNGQSLLMSFGSYWKDIYQIPMSNPPLAIAGNAVPTQLEFNNTTRPPNAGPAGPQEGSYQFWWNVGGTDYYYLFFSSGACCNSADQLAPPGEEYKVMVCRSTEPSNGFVGPDGTSCLNNGGALVLGSHDNVYAPGGQGVFYDDTVGSPVLYYHYVNPSIGYATEQFQFGWNKLDFSSGWPVVVV